MTTLEQEFNLAMHEIYHKAKAIGYTASYFFQMLNERGGVSTAKDLINATTVSSGYTKLWEMKRLDLTVEALVYENSEWHSLFTSDELEKCRNRLVEFGYNLKQ